MDEKLLQYAWQHLQFALFPLATTSGESVVIHNPGELNRDQGPDFLFASIAINEQKWYGAIEIHLNSEDWYQHGHHRDSRYNATILHVVAHSTGKPIFRADGTTIPELQIGMGLPTVSTLSHAQMHSEKSTLPCAFGLAHVSPLVRDNWLVNMGWGRLEQRAQALLPKLELHKGDWEQLLWIQVCAALGAPHNSEAFIRLAHILPAGIVRKYIRDPERLEVLLLGAAGMLATPQDSYSTEMATEWSYLQSKHRLQQLPESSWVYLRMRPAHFPGLRLAQLAQLLARCGQLFSLVTEPKHLQKPVAASPYWDRHYQMGKPTAAVQTKRMGVRTLQGLIINALAPFAVCYYTQTGAQEKLAQVQDWLTELAPEDNRITRVYTAIGFPNPNAFYSQALLHLHKTYCTPLHCAKCAIGHQVLTPPHKP